MRQCSAADAQPADDVDGGGVAEARADLDDRERRERVDPARRAREQPRELPRLRRPPQRPCVVRVCARACRGGRGATP